MTAPKRRSTGMAEVAFKAVEDVVVGLSAEGGRQRLARAQDFPIVLHRAGLTTALTQFEAKARSRDDYRFVAEAVKKALDVKQAADLCDKDTVAYRRLTDEARTFAWWLKRASEATWAGGDDGA